MITPAARRSCGRIVCRALLTAWACVPALAGAQLPSEQRSTLAPMIERVSPAVVNISVSGSLARDNPLAEDPFFRRFFPDGDRRVRSAGSGVIVDAERGYVLTNHHVVSNAETITVTLSDTRSLEATVIGSDEGSDIAVLGIDAAELAEIQLGDSDSLRVGDFVVAIGNPYGLSNTVTSGIVSGLGRSNISPDAYAYEDFIQTDASINPGNSGGALVGLDGDLVGINSAILSRGGGNIGIGFAIPVNMARYVMDQLIEHGTVQRGLLGVVINSVTPEIADSLGLPDTSGAVVRSVTPGSAADAAGLQVDDVIVSVDDRPIGDAGSLRNAIGLLPPGASVRVGYVRDGSRNTTEAVLGNAEDAAAALPADPANGGETLLDDVELEPAPGFGGLRVSAMADGSAAAMRGLRVGDVITHVNGQRVGTPDEAEAAAAGAPSVIFDVERDGRSLSVVMR